MMRCQDAEARLCPGQLRPLRGALVALAILLAASDALATGVKQFCFMVPMRPTSTCPACPDAPTR
jgi:hypothetical protein